MAVPELQAFFRPVLAVLADGRERTSSEIRDQVAEKLGLSEADRLEAPPAGGHSRLYQRVMWATTYLRAANLIERYRKGVFKLTERGNRLLAAKPPSRIDLALLGTYPEFVEWSKRGEGSTTGTDTVPATTPVAPSTEVPGKKVPPDAVFVDQLTPEELIGKHYRTLQRSVQDDLLSKIIAAPPKFFEQLVIDLLVRMGYGGSRADAGQALGKAGDEGVDGIIKEDRLGLESIYVQAKRWNISRTVGRPDVQAFAGSLEGQRARKGVFITTATFSRDAYDYVGRIERKIVLIDGQKLTALMHEYNVGVRTKQTYELKEVDEDFFTEE